MIDYAGIFEMETDELFHRLAAIEDELFLYPRKPTISRELELLDEQRIIWAELDIRGYEIVKIPIEQANPDMAMITATNKKIRGY